ncbi:MAG: ATP-dependent helicase [Deltaproteobacteria bacterium]|nr:ATP-dependent helicase [Deltaproteobacteria bacterium]
MAASALEGLNPEQRQAVEMTEGPLLVIAGAGSGKTRTLVHRVAHLLERGERPSSLLLVTFTRRASAEMLSRARQMHPGAAAVAGGTFHSICLRILRVSGRHLGLPPNFTIIDQADQEALVRHQLNDLGLKSAGESRFPKPRSLVSLFSRARNLEMDLETALEALAPHWLEHRRELAAVHHGFALAKTSQGLLDYDDLLFRTEELLLAQPEVRQEVQRRWRRLMVDEYQDTNAVQARLLRLWCDEAQHIMVVGDDAQSIYRFRGARHQNILDFPRLFPGTAVVKLQKNYRSTPAILGLTNAIIAQAAVRYEKELFTDNPDGPAPKLLRPKDERGQSRAVVEAIRGRLHQGAQPEEVAVLFRAGRDSFDLEKELTVEGLGFVKYGGQRFLEAAHVKDLLSHLRVVANPLDFLSWQRILLLVPKVGPKTAQQILGHLAAGGGEPRDYLLGLAGVPTLVKNPVGKKLAKLMAELADPALPPLDAVEAAIKYYTPICKDLFDDHPRRLADLNELPGMARQYEHLEDFLGETALDTSQDNNGGDSGRNLTLSTIHSAKGMEWPHVFLIWATDGRLPAFASFQDSEGLEEERRLLYVACTRAGRDLTILAPRELYAPGERRVIPQTISRFLEDLDPGLLEAESPGLVFPEFAAPPVSRGSQRQDRPFAVGSQVAHATFGRGKVMGYQGDKKILVHFGRYGLKILLLEFAHLTQA